MNDIRDLLDEIRGFLYNIVDTEINKYLPAPTTIDEKRMDRAGRLSRIDPAELANSEIPRIMRLIERIETLSRRNTDATT